MTDKWKPKFGSPLSLSADFIIGLAGASKEEVHQRLFDEEAKQYPSTKESDEYEQRK
jgi:hypothetical protein